MAHQPYAAYAQNEVLTATPERLVEILYDLGIQSIVRARECHSAKDIKSRVWNINKAFAAIVELGNSLDFEAGGEIALNYARIYDYCQRKLLEANVKQSDNGLAEVQSLLSDLKEAWQVVIIKVGADRIARLLSPEVLPGERELAGSINCIG